MLYAVSLAHVDIYSAEDAPADGAPFMCPRCHSRVILRATINQRPHWSHGRTHSMRCALRRDAVSGHGHAKRTAAELNTYES
ncbi:competence protein CoiA family protein [Streptomyces sp. NPDC001982]|uniref:competence protein CoiA family protein n=2 Tax=unclassified Streptomyces TaxID=2593676 RepID=UPI00332D3514